MSHEIKFGTLHPDGSVTDERSIPQANIMSCPHLIMVPEHYDDMGRCRCEDPDHQEQMRDWGYGRSPGSPLRDGERLVDGEVLYSSEWLGEGG